MLWLLLDACAAQVTQMSINSPTKKCKKWHYGSNCLKCSCNFSNSKNCDNLTGRCICKPGYTGTHCDVDVDECAAGAGDKLCKDKYMFCKNTFGSFECLCKRGFFQAASGKCVPCIGDKAGTNCGKKCDCHAQNSVGCATPIGTCLCHFGWEGVRCESSIDDCVGNPCKKLPCVDSHRSYICVCGKGKRYVGGNCRDFSVDMMVTDATPVMGQIMEIFILYSLSLPYQLNPIGNPDFLYDLYVNSEHACKISFHHSYEKMSRKNKYIKQLNVPSGKKYHFYSHIRVRLMATTLISLKAVPASKEIPEMTLLFTPNPQPDSVAKCLSNMSISGTLPCKDKTVKCAEVLKVPEGYKKHYRTFKIQLGGSGECKDLNPKYSWHYKKLTDLRGQGWCYDSSTLSDLDITDLVEYSGQPFITDQFGEIDVMPQSTLPVGIVLICVRVELHDDPKQSAVVCGTRRFLFSNIVIGQVKPVSFPWFLCDTRAQYDLHADYRHEDPQMKLKFTWKRMTKFIWSTLIGPKVSPVDLVGWDYFILWRNTHRANLSISSSAGHIKTEEFTVHTTGVSVAMAFALNNKWTLTKGSQVLKTVPGDHTVVSGSQLRPGKYLLEYSGNMKWYTTNPPGYIKFEFRMESAPLKKKGDCNISPLIGQASFTEFTVSCPGYEDEGKKPLRFHLYQKESAVGQNDSFFYTLVAYGGNETMTGLILSTPDICSPTLNDIELKVKVLNTRSSALETNLQVTFNTSIDEEEVFDVAHMFLDRANVAEPRQGNLRLIIYIANLINCATTVSANKRIKMRNRLLKRLAGYKSRTPRWLELSALALDKATAQEEEISRLGLRSGVLALHQIVSHLHTVGLNNIYTAENVVRLLMSASSRLLSVAHDEGRALATRQISAETRFLLEKSKQNAKKGIAAIEKIADVMSRILTGCDNERKLTFEHIDIGIATHTANTYTGFDIAKDTIGRFKIKTYSITQTRNEIVDASYKFYEKNPYAFATRDVHGNFPVMHIDFTTTQRSHIDIQQPRSERLTDFRNIRFIKPADLLLNLNKSVSKTVEYPATIDVERRADKKILVKSSCVFMAVPSSMIETTVLQIYSSDFLPLKVQIVHTDNVHQFHTGEEMAMDLPIRHPPMLKTTHGIMMRDPNLVFLPHLRMPGTRARVGYYRVKISAKLDEEISTHFMNLDSRQGAIQGSDSALEEIEAYTTAFRVTPYGLSCQHFDENTDTFTSDKCLMSRFSNLDQFHCRCITAGAFTASVLGRVESINPLDFGLVKEHFYNPVVITLLVATWMFFFAAIRWARLKDKHDIDMCQVTVLEDNSDHHTYMYMICVTTGWAVAAATSSKVHIYLKGSWAQSKIHRLQDNNKPLFERGANNWFLITTAHDIGSIESVVIWTDFSGPQPSWFLISIAVENLQTNESWIFQYNSWLSIVFGRKRLVAEIPNFLGESRKWTEQLKKQTRGNMRNDHMWVGLFSKSPWDKFTRVSRLVTLLTVVQTMMLFNLVYVRDMFDSPDQGRYLMILSQVLHLTSVLISIKSAVLMTVLGVGLAFVLTRTSKKPVDQCMVLSDEQLEMIIRGQDMNSRNMQGLKQVFPFFSRKDEDSSVDEESQVNVDHATAPPEQELSKQSTVSELQTDSGEAEPEEASKMTKGKDKSKEREEKERKRCQEAVNAKRQQALKQNFMLPHWNIYLTGVLLCVYNVMLVLYILLYGVSLPRKESSEWILISFMAFVFNFVFFMPLAVFLSAAISVLIFKKQKALGLEAPISDLAEGQRMLMREKMSKYSVTGTQRKRRRVDVLPFPISLADARHVLERLRVESKAREMLRDIVVYTLFMVTVVIIVNDHIDVHKEYMQKISVESELLGLEREELRDYYEGDQLSQIHDEEALWDYLTDVITPKLVPKVDSMEQNPSRNFYLVTNARLRQVRTVADASYCFEGIPSVVWERDQYHNCSRQLDGVVPEETHHFNQSWTSTAFDFEALDSDSPFLYHLATNLKTSTFTGQHGVYSGGGYISTISREGPTTVQERMRSLYKMGWIDRFSRHAELTVIAANPFLMTMNSLNEYRCIFLEFTVYNPSVDMFTQVIIAFELDIYGGIFVSKTINTANLSATATESRTWFKIVEITAGLCGILHIITALNRLRRSGVGIFFSNIWNWMEVLVGVLTLLSVMFFLLRAISYSAIMEEFKANGHSYYLDFSSVFFWQTLFHFIMGLLGALVILKMLKVTTFNPFMKAFINTWAIGYVDFQAFLFSTAFFILAYGSLGRLVLGNYTKSYSTFGRTLLTLLFFILGEPDFYVLVEVNLFLGRLFFLTFMVISQYFVLFIFIAILRDAYEMARFVSTKHERAVIAYMVQTVMLYFNVVSDDSRNQRKE